MNTFKAKNLGRLKKNPSINVIDSVDLLIIYTSNSIIKCIMHTTFNKSPKIFIMTYVNFLSFDLFTLIVCFYLDVLLNL